MKQARVWFTESWSSGLQVRFNSGEAIDAGDGYGTPEGVLHYDGDLNNILQDFDTVYRVPVDYLCRQFYFTEEEARSAAVKSGIVTHEDVNVQSGHIQHAVYKPISLPAAVLLEENSRGVFCRMNLHPEIFGAHQKGKLYFADRSCRESLCAGPAVITDVFERTSYGFVIGYMKKFEAPTEEMVADFLIRTDIPSPDVKYCCNKFGSFALVNNKCLIRENEAASLCEVDLLSFDGNLTILDSVGGADLICRDYA